MMRRFLRYTEKVFGLSRLVGGLTEYRQRPQVPIATVWMSALVMMVTRLGSLNALEGVLRVAGRLEGIVGRRTPSADTVGRVLCGVDPDELRTMLARLVHRLARNKALGRIGAMRFVAVDGHEFFSLTAPLLRGVPAAPGGGGR